MDTNIVIALAGVILALPPAILAFLQILDRRTSVPSKMSQPTQVLSQIHIVKPKYNYYPGKFGLSVAAMFACISSLALAVIFSPNWYSPTPRSLAEIFTDKHLLLVDLLIISALGWLICEAILIYCTVERKQLGWLFVIFLSVVAGIASVILTANGVLPVWLYPSWILSPVLYGWLTKE